MAAWWWRHNINVQHAELLEENSFCVQWVAGMWNSCIFNVPPSASEKYKSLGSRHRQGNPSTRNDDSLKGLLNSFCSHLQAEQCWWLMLSYNGTDTGLLLCPVSLWSFWCHWMRQTWDLCRKTNNSHFIFYYIHIIICFLDQTCNVHHLPAETAHYYDLVVLCTCLWIHH